MESALGPDRRWRVLDYLLLPVALPVLLLLIYYSKRRSPLGFFQLAWAFIARSFVVFAILWVTLGLTSWLLDHQHMRSASLPAVEDRRTRCLLETPVCTLPDAINYGPLVWTVVHVTAVPTAVAVRVLDAVGQPSAARWLTLEYREFFSSYAGRDILHWNYFVLGLVAYLTLLLFPVVVLVWLLSFLKHLEWGNVLPSLH